MFKIFNEEKHAEQMLENGFLLKEVNSYELGILSKYYFTELKLNRNKVRDKLVEFCKEYDKNFDEVIYRKMLNGIVEYGKKFDFVNVDIIKITKNELEVISKINDFKREKILFVMLVFAKYRNMLNLEKDVKIRKESKKHTRNGLDRYFVTEKHSAIIRNAKVTMSVKNRNVVFRYFEDLGIVKMTNNCNFELLFVEKINENSEVVIEIDNFEDFIYHYYKWKDEKSVVECDVCGRPILKTSNRKKYCNSCWKEKDLELNKKRCAKYYKNKNSHGLDDHENISNTNNFHVDD